MCDEVPSRQKTTSRSGLVLSPPTEYNLRLVFSLRGAAYESPAWLPLVQLLFPRGLSWSSTKSGNPLGEREQQLDREHPTRKRNGCETIGDGLADCISGEGRVFHVILKKISKAPLHRVRTSSRDGRPRGGPTDKDPTIIPKRIHHERSRVLAVRIMAHIDPNLYCKCSSDLNSRLTMQEVDTFFLGG